jgi:hypothetical protein
VKTTDVIPLGEYCYDNNGTCPYWELRLDRPKQENGYCAYLERGDWDTNASTQKTLTDHKGEKWSPAEMPFGVGLLWDQCKECGVNISHRRGGGDR